MNEDEEALGLIGGVRYGKEKKDRNLSMSDKIILNSGYILLGIFLLAIIVPLIYVIVASFMDPVVLSSEGITFDFSKWSLEGYKRVSKR